ncbi:MAG: alpha/beta hydrolase [Pseudomonadota bacterium]
MNTNPNLIRRRILQALALSPMALSFPWAIGKETTAEVKARRQYVDGVWGQVHVYSVIPEVIRQNALMCFHPSPTSGNYFRDYMLSMGTDRMVFAMDTPGYGKSDPPPEPPAIKELAENAAVTLEELGFGSRGGGPVDAIGYHTGCLIAAELAIIRPDLIRRLVLPGIPYYEGKARQEAYENYAKPSEKSSDGKHIITAWEFWTKNLLKEGVSLDRITEHFADQMRAGSNSWWAYHGVFSYEAEKRFPLVKQPVLVPNNYAGLEDASRAAAKLMQNAKVIEMPELSKGIFDAAVKPLVKVSRGFLDT